MLLYSYDSLDAIPAEFQSLYTEKDGKWILTGIQGIKTQADVDAVSKALSGERTAHKATKERFRYFMEMNDDQLQEQITKLDNYEALEAKANANPQPDETKIEAIAAAKVKQQVVPLERERDALKATNTDLTNKVNSFIQADKTRKIHDAVRAAAVTSKMLAPAVEDAILMAERVMEVTDDDKVVVKDQVGFTPGVEADIWLSDMQSKRPHWWPESEGGGARGSNNNGHVTGNNPWGEKTFNMTEQGNFIKKHGMEKAQQMAAQAGSRVGATSPTKR